MLEQLLLLLGVIMKAVAFEDFPRNYASSKELILLPFLRYLTHSSASFSGNFE